MADIFSMWALKTTVKYLPRIAKDKSDHEARSQMLQVSFVIILANFLMDNFDIALHLPSLGSDSETLVSIYVTE